jgi:hypothetical protein
MRDYLARVSQLVLSFKVSLSTEKNHVVQPSPPRPSVEVPFMEQNKFNTWPTKQRPSRIIKVLGVMDSAKVMTYSSKFTREGEAEAICSVSGPAN